MATSLSCSDLVASLSHAMDLTEGQPPGHAVRSCMVGMEIARELGLSAAERSDLYYTLLLKDAGCSANAAPVARAFGSDDHPVKRALKTTDWSRYLSAARYALTWAAVDGTPWRRLRHVIGLARGGDGMARELTRIRCHQGAGIAQQLGFPEATAEAIRNLDEHWDGRGHPDGIAGEEIPLLARIAGLAQAVDVFLQEEGVEATLTMVRERRGRWFDPRLADVVLGWEGRTAWWANVRFAMDADALVGLEPPDRVRLLDGGELDRVAEAFAEIIDAKSPFTYRHSRRVGEIAAEIGAAHGMDEDARRRLYRAGLLHDVGKLGISNRILDKPGRLTEMELDRVRQHPRFSLDILRHVAAFADVASPAAHHHERVDGRGYPWGLDGDGLDDTCRILAVADVFEALTARRPYRDPLPVAGVMEILEGDPGLDRRFVGLLAGCVDADGRVRAHGGSGARPREPRGVTEKAGSGGRRPDLGRTLFPAAAADLGG